MNLPNKLTILRVVLAPFFVLLLLCAKVPQRFLWAGLVFAAAALTDLLDGKIARKTGKVTDFGKFADPLADKILVMSAFICFIELNIISCLPVIIMLAREFIVSAVRMDSAAKGEVIAANAWGKAKTITQIAAIGIILLFLHLNNGNIGPGMSLNICIISVWLSVFASLMSGFGYIKNFLISEPVLIT